MSATNPYRDYAIDYASKPESHGDTLAYRTPHSQVRHDRSSDMVYGPGAPPAHAAFDQSPHASAGTVVSLPASTAAMVHGIPQAVMPPYQHPYQHLQLLHRHLPPQYSPASLGMPSPQRGTKRTHGDAETEDDDGGRTVKPPLTGSIESQEAPQTPEILFPPQREQPSSHEFDTHITLTQTPHRQHYSHSSDTPSHSSLPDNRQSTLVRRSSSFSGHQSLVGVPGMPAPAPPPRGPKLRFTDEDDRLLRNLKEDYQLSWRKIADFFPGRASGTLQVRYCTKVKEKDVIWSDDMVKRLRRAMDEYEKDRWRIIATKVGHGVTQAACKTKAEQL